MERRTAGLLLKAMQKMSIDNCGRRRRLPAIGRHLLQALALSSKCG